jgi:hypothetical protein
MLCPKFMLFLSLKTTLLNAIWKYHSCEEYGIVYSLLSLILWGRTALHLASCEGRAEIIKFLLTAKANVAFKDRMGNNALDDAVRHGHRDIQLILQAAGATVGGCVTCKLLSVYCAALLCLDGLSRFCSVCQSLCMCASLSSSLHTHSICPPTSTLYPYLCQCLI